MAPTSLGEDIRFSMYAYSAQACMGAAAKRKTPWSWEQLGICAYLGLMPGTFSALEAAALLLKVSLSTLLPLRDGAESEMV